MTMQTEKTGRLALGAEALVRRTYDAERLKRFETLTGIMPDTVPEPLIAALFSYLLGVKLPGPGTNYLKQELEFLASAPIDEELEARVEVTRLRPEKHLVDLAAECRTRSGTLICRGRSLVLAKDVGA